MKDEAISYRFIIFKLLNLTIVFVAYSQQFREASEALECYAQWMVFWCLCLGFVLIYCL